MLMRMIKGFSVTWKQVIALLTVFFLYSFEPIAAKYTSSQEWLSIPFWIGLMAVFGVLGLYAVLWQQLLKRLPLSIAYMFRGSTLVFVMLLSVLFFGDAITVFNVIGAAVIFCGIVLYSLEV